MADLKSTVALTNNSLKVLSRRELLDWVNETVNGKYMKIEELCSGVAYCQIMEKLFPNCIGLKKIRTKAKLEHEQMHNLRLLQMALTRLKFDKTIPMDRLLKGRFQDNFEFLQWFKKFCDTACVAKGKENLPNGSSSSSAKPKTSIKTVVTPSDLSDQSDLSASSSSFSLSRDDLEAKIAQAGEDRDFYFKKLTAIEELLKKANSRGEHVGFCQRALMIINKAESDIPVEELY